MSHEARSRRGGLPPRSWLFSLAGVVLLGAPALSFAHKVNMFAFVEGDAVKVEGYFADGKKAANSEVTIFGAGDKLLFKGVTDAEGSISFPVPREASIKIVLNAGMGHQSSYELSGVTAVSAEVNQAERRSLKVEAVKAPAMTSPGSEPQDHSHAPGGEMEGVAQAPISSPTDNVQVDAAVQRAVAHAMAPLVKEIRDAQQRATLTEIIGGLGYIMGLLGVAAYMHARKVAPPRAPSRDV